MKIKSKVAILVVVLGLFLPIIKVDYFTGEKMVVKNQSIAEILIQDFVDGTFGTGF